MITNILLGTTETTIKAAPADKNVAVLSMIFCNTTTSEKTITVYVYPTGSAGNDSTTIIKNYIIPAEDSYVWTANEKFILGPSDIISGVASVASSITVTANWMEI
jgi:hypothetical protein